MSPKTTTSGFMLRKSSPFLIPSVFRRNKSIWWWWQNKTGSGTHSWSKSREWSNRFHYSSFSARLESYPTARFVNISCLMWALAAAATATGRATMKPVVAQDSRTDYLKRFRRLSLTQMELWHKTMLSGISHPRSYLPRSIWIKKRVRWRSANSHTRFFTMTSSRTVRPPNSGYSSSVIWRTNCSAPSLKSTNRTTAIRIWINA